MKAAFEELMNELDEVKQFLAEEKKGSRTHIPDKVDVKGIRSKLKMTQSRFSDTFGFSPDAIKHWEGGWLTPEAPARALLTVIDKNPAAVISALYPRFHKPLTTKERAKAIARARRNVRRHVKRGRSLVDELIAERRSWARSE